MSINMHTLQFLQDYFVTIALTNKALLAKTTHDVVNEIQAIYDNSNVAGSFSVKRFGDQVMLITFHRDLSEDSEALELDLHAMTVEAMLDQLRVEFSGVEGGWLGRVIAEALDISQAEVVGLPCQYPRIRFELDVCFPSADHRHLAREKLSEALETVAEEHGGTLIQRNQEYV